MHETTCWVVGHAKEVCVEDVEAFYKEIGTGQPLIKGMCK